MRRVDISMQIKFQRYLDTGVAAKLVCDVDLRVANQCILAEVQKVSMLFAIPYHDLKLVVLRVLQVHAA